MPGTKLIHINNENTIVSNLTSGWFLGNWPVALRALKRENQDYTKKARIRPPTFAEFCQNQTL